MTFDILHDWGIKGLLYDAFGEQRHPYHPETKDQAQAFIDRQMAMKKKIGLIG